MPKGKKTSTTETTTPVPVPVPVPALAPVAEVTTASKPKKSRAPKSEPSTNQVQDTAPVSTSVTDVVDSDDVQAVDDVATQTMEFVTKLNQLSAMIASLKTEYRVLEKRWTRELKTAQKVNSKRKRKSGNRAPSGFVKPTRISDELAKFLDKPSGTEMARTDVTREINKYIRTHELQDKSNGRKINPDVKLQGLLKLGSGEELTYFNLQRYMSPHFAKSVQTATATA
jgi:chromatin remodeling complex protein RSC6